MDPLIDAGKTQADVGGGSKKSPITASFSGGGSGHQSAVVSVDHADSIPSFIGGRGGVSRQGKTIAAKAVTESVLHPVRSGASGEFAEIPSQLVLMGLMRQFSKPYFDPSQPEGQIVRNGNDPPGGRLGLVGSDDDNLLGQAKVGPLKSVNLRRPQPGKGSDGNR